MTALLRYQAAVLLRSHRWIFPLIGYAVLVAVGAAGSATLSDTLGWSAAMLVPVTAFLTRAMLTAEPDAARACVAAAAGPARAQLATLLVPLGGGALLGLVTAFLDVLLARAAARNQQPGLSGKLADAAAHPGIVVAGLLIALVCVAVGSAAGVLCNPPLLRHPAVAMLATLTAVIVALAADVSPASAAVGRAGTQAAGPLAAAWPGPGSLLGAAGLLAITWTVSVVVASHRDAGVTSGA